MVGQQTCWYPRGDVFSMGVVFYQLINDQTPNDEIGKMGLFTEGFTGQMDSIVHFTKTRQPNYKYTEENFPGIYEFLPGMLSKDRKSRPTSSLAQTFEIDQGGFCSSLNMALFES